MNELNNFQTFVGTTPDAEWCKNIAANGDPNPEGLSKGDENGSPPKKTPTGTLALALKKRMKPGVELKTTEIAAIAKRVLG